MKEVFINQKLDWWNNYLLTRCWTDVIILGAIFTDGNNLKPRRLPTLTIDERQCLFKWKLEW